MPSFVLKKMLIYLYSGMTNLAESQKVEQDLANWKRRDYLYFQLIPES